MCACDRWLCHVRVRPVVVGRGLCTTGWLACPHDEGNPPGSWALIGSCAQFTSLGLGRLELGMCPPDSRVKLEHSYLV